MYNGYVDPYEEPSNLGIARFNAILREKILGIASTEEPLIAKQSNVIDNNKSEDLLEDELFEYVPMF